MKTEKNQETKNVVNKDKENQHVVEDATVTVNAAKPPMGKMTYALCEVVENGDKFEVTPLKKEECPKNKRIFQMNRMTVHTRKDGTYMLALSIRPDEDKGNVVSLVGDFEAGLTCALEYDRHRKGGKR